jgi:hypothetical protein
MGAGSLKLAEHRAVFGEPDGEAVAELLGRLVLQRLLVDELSAEPGDVDAGAMRLVEHVCQGGPVALGGEPGVGFTGQLAPPASQLPCRDVLEPRADLTDGGQLLGALTSAP